MCAYYEWFQETGEGECLPNWTYYDRGGGSAGDTSGGGGGAAVGGEEPIYASGAFGPWEQGLEEPCEYGDGLGGSADFEDGWDWDA